MFLKKVDRDSRDYSMSNPLLLRMIVEIAEDDPDVKLSETNMFEVYNDFTRKMVEKTLKKGENAEKDIATMFWNSANIADFYTKNAFQTVLNDKNDLKKSLIDPLFKRVSSPTLDEIFRVGLMFNDGTGNFHFMHRTFAEFYVAKFFYETIFVQSNKSKRQHSDGNLKRIATFFVDGILSYGWLDFSFTIFLIDCVFENDELRSPFNFPEAAKTILEDRLEYLNFERLAANGNLNLIKLFTLRLDQKIQEVLFSNGHDYWNLLMYAFYNQSFGFVDGFLSFLIKLDSARTKQMFFDEGSSGENIFHSAAGNDLLGLAVERSKAFMSEDECADLLTENCRYGSVIHIALRAAKDVPKVIKILKQKLVKPPNSIFGCKALVNVLLAKDDNGRTALDCAFSGVLDSDFAATKKFYFEVFGEERMKSVVLGKQELDIIFATEQDVLLEASKHFRASWPKIDYHMKMSGMDRFFTFIADLFGIRNRTLTAAIFLSGDEDDETLLISAAKNDDEESFSEILKYFHENVEQGDLIEILKVTSPQSECVFHCAAKNYFVETFKLVYKLFRENFDNQDFKRIVLDCNRSWLLDVVKSYHFRNEETHSEFCNLLQEMFGEKEFKKSAEKLFLFADNYGKTVLMEAAEYGNRIFESFFSLAKKVFTYKQIKKFLLAEDKSGANAFFLSLQSGSVDTFEAVRKSYEDLFENDEIKEIVLKKVGGSNIIAYSMRNSDFESFTHVCEFVFELFSDEKQKIESLFMEFDNTDQTILMEAASTNADYFEVLANLIEKAFCEDQIEELLLLINGKGLTALHYAIAADVDLPRFSIAVDFYMKVLGREAIQELIFDEVGWWIVLNECSNFEHFLAFIEDLFRDDRPELKEFLQKELEGSEYLFHYAAKNCVVEVFKFVVKLYRENFDNQEFKRNVLDCSESWLLDVVRSYRYRGGEAHKEFRNLLQEMFEEKEFTESAEKLFLFADKFGQTVLMEAVESRQFEAHFGLAKKIFTNEKIKKIFLAEDNRGAIVFFHSLQSGSVNTFNSVRKAYEELFERDEIKEIVLKKVGGSNIIACSMPNYGSKSFSHVCEFVFELFSDEKQKIENLFMKFDDSDQTILMKAARSDQNYFAVLANLIEKLFDKDNIKKILLLKNRKGRTALHFAFAADILGDTITFVVDFYMKVLGRESMKELILVVKSIGGTF